MAEKRIPLPIDPILPEVVRTPEKSDALVLQASPGSGKTTRVPPALLAAHAGEILVLEPRRLAAKYAASRVAEEMGDKVGGVVGYQFRFENVTSPKTRLRFLTEGMLMRRLLGDPTLNKVSAVILDEFHERHLHGDIAIAYLRQLQKTKRPDLKLIVMSATLDTEAISRFLGNCPVLRVDAAVHPVTIEHLPSPPAKHLELTVKDAVNQLLPRDNGDILVFLPGMADIRRSAEALQPLTARGMLVLPLHGELTREEQDLAIKRGTKRKIILSTNVAETSLTIEGITGVIDSGLHRQASYSWWSGLPALKTRPISRASAIQRAGRAGRTAPGVCLRLYTKGDFDSRPPFEVPEIQRADLTQTILELKSFGMTDLKSFPWFEAPAGSSLDSAEKLLYGLGAVDGAGAITALGVRMVRIPAHPRIGRMLLEAGKLDVLEPAATLASLISEGLLERLDAIEQALDPRIDFGARRARTHLLNAFEKTSSGSDPHRLARSVLAGFPDRVARKKKIAAHVNRGRENEVELIFSSGGSGLVPETGVVLEGDTFIALDVQEQQHLGQTRAQRKVRSLVRIEADWLLDVEPSPVEEKTHLIFDEQRKKVFEVTQMTYGDLALTEDRAEPKDPAAASTLYLKATLGIDPAKLPGFSAEDWITSLSRLTDAETAETAIGRFVFLQQNAPQLDLKLAPAVAQILETRKPGELKELDWPSELPLASAPERFSEMEKLAPASIVLPSGRKTRVHYKPGQPPWVESRLQDFFGMKKGPALLDGRMPLTLHLLAPNMRAVQVTTDLAGFWERHYPELRKTLSRRYPRHKWPENPLEKLI